MYLVCLVLRASQDLLVIRKQYLVIEFQLCNTTVMHSILCCDWAVFLHFKTILVVLAFYDSRNPVNNWMFVFIGLVIFLTVYTRPSQVKFVKHHFENVSKHKSPQLIDISGMPPSLWLRRIFNIVVQLEKYIRHTTEGCVLGVCTPALFLKKVIVAFSSENF